MAEVTFFIKTANAMKKLLSRCLILLAMMMTCSGTSFSVAQDNHAELVEQTGSEDLRERLGAIRGLGVAIARDLATPEQRLLSIKILRELSDDKEPVARLGVNVELLKIAAAENDVELSKFALRVSEDENVNVRRGIMKFFRSYYGNRYEFGKAHELLLLKKIDDADLATRFHAAATLHSWGISNDKIINIMLDSLDLRSYRAASSQALITNEKNRQKLIAILLGRMRNSEHNVGVYVNLMACLLYTSPSPRDATLSRMPSSA